MDTIVLDTSVLSPFARAVRLDMLDSLTADSRRLITRSVRDEIEAGCNEFPALSRSLNLPWIETVRLDGPKELQLFGVYVHLLGDEETRNIGESSVLAFAEVHHCIALCDDDTAVHIARSRYVDVRRSLALIIGGVKKDLLSERQAADLLNDLIDGGGRYPCTGVELLTWARLKGLL